MEDSIRLRFRSDVPVGSCLSGGIDSGVIVGLSTKNIAKPLHTFSCIYPNHPEFDESYYIQESVKKFGTIASYVEPNYNNYLDEVRASIYEQDCPTGGASVLSQRAVMQLAGQHVRVVLDGQGADELLGGYHGYFRYSLQTQFRQFRQEKSLKKLMSYLDSSRKIKKRIGKKVGSFAQYLYLTNTPVKFYSNALQGQLSFFEEYESDDLSTLLLEHVFTNLTNLLHYEDRNSMRFSVEARLPYLDYRLVEYAFSLPHAYKIRQDTTKWVLNKVAKDVLPSSVYNRKDKMGYTTPAHIWLGQAQNIKSLRPYFEKNALFSSLTQDLQNILKNFYRTLASGKPLSLQQSAYMNVFWRHITASMWLESL